MPLLQHTIKNIGSEKVFRFYSEKGEVGSESFVYVVIDKEPEAKPFDQALRQWVRTEGRAIAVGGGFVGVPLYMKHIQPVVAQYQKFETLCCEWFRDHQRYGNQQDSLVNKAEAVPLLQYKIDNIGREKVFRFYVAKEANEDSQLVYVVIDKEPDPHLSKYGLMDWVRKNGKAICMGGDFNGTPIYVDIGRPVWVQNADLKNICTDWFNARQRRFPPMGNPTISPSPSLRDDLERNLKGLGATGRINQIWDHYSHLIETNAISLTGEEKQVLGLVVADKPISVAFVESLVSKIAALPEHSERNSAASTLRQKMEAVSYVQRLATIEALSRPAKQGGNDHTAPTVTKAHLQQRIAIIEATLSLAENNMMALTSADDAKLREELLLLTGWLDSPVKLVFEVTAWVERRLWVVNGEILGERSDFILDDKGETARDLTFSAWPIDGCNQGETLLQVQMRTAIEEHLSLLKNDITGNDPRAKIGQYQGIPRSLGGKGQYRIVSEANPRVLAY